MKYELLSVSMWVRGLQLPQLHKDSRGDWGLAVLFLLSLMLTLCCQKVTISSFVR